MAASSGVKCETVFTAARVSSRRDPTAAHDRAAIPSPLPAWLIKFRRFIGVDFKGQLLNIRCKALTRTIHKRTNAHSQQAAPLPFVNKSVCRVRNITLHSRFLAPKETGMLQYNPLALPITESVFDWYIRHVGLYGCTPLAFRRLGASSIELESKQF